MNPGRILGLIACLALAMYTGNKLHTMLVIRGTLDGAIVENHIVTGKQKTPSRRGDAYWISWAKLPSSRADTNRVNLQFDAWNAINVGDEIELLFVGDDTTPYLRDGIYAADDNLIFDGVLLAAELFGAGFCLLPLFQRRAEN